MLDPLLLVGAIFLIAIVWYRVFYRPGARSVEHQRSGLGVEQLLEKLRAELEQADRKRTDTNQSALLRLQGVELEISFVVKRSETSSAEAKFEVVTVGEAETVDREEVQRLKLTWLPTPDRSGSTAIQSEPQLKAPAATHAPKK